MPSNMLVPKRTVVIVIDVQNDFCHADGTMARSGLETGNVRLAVSRIDRFLRLARDYDVPIVFVRTEHDVFVDSLAWRLRVIGRQIEDADGPAINCETGSWGADYYLIKPEPDDHVVIKHRYSAFSSPGFDEVLRGLGRSCLLLTGVSTHICVESTVRDAIDRDYFASIVSDCCATYDMNHHVSAVERMNNDFGPSLVAADIDNAWASL